MLIAIIECWLLISQNHADKKNRRTFVDVIIILDEKHCADIDFNFPLVNQVHPILCADLNR